MSKILEKLKNQVFNTRPALREIYNSFGSQNLFDYVNSWPIKPAKETLFLSCFKELVQEFYPHLADGLYNQLKETSLVSTIDHHGILNHPFFVNANLVYSLKKKLKYLIVLPTAGVSMNNNSSFSGSFVFTDAAQKLHRLPLYSNKVGMQPVFSVPGFREAQINWFKKQVKTNIFLSNSQKAIIEEKIYPIMLKSQGINMFSDQAVHISNNVWKTYFPEAPVMAYIPLENIINRILVTLLEQKDSFFHFLFCEEKGWKFFEHYFQGIAGAFSGPQKGSFLFWGIDKQGRRVHVQREGNKIYGTGFSAELTANDLVRCIKNNTLYPSSLVCFLILLNYEITCLGGFNQTTWLTEIKKRFVELINNVGDASVAKRVNEVPTEVFAETNLAFFKNENGSYPASGLDVLFAQEPNFYEKLMAASKEITLGECIDTMMPEIYQIAVPYAERDLSLLRP